MPSAFARRASSELERAIGRDVPGPHRPPQDRMPCFEVDHVANQPGGGVDRDALDGRDLQWQELADQSGTVRAETHGPLAHHVEFVGGRPGVLGGQVGDRPHLVDVGLPAQLDRVLQPLHGGRRGVEQVQVHVFDYRSIRPS